MHIYFQFSHELFSLLMIFIETNSVVNFAYLSCYIKFQASKALNRSVVAQSCENFERIL